MRRRRRSAQHFFLIDSVDESDDNLLHETSDGFQMHNDLHLYRFNETLSPALLPPLSHRHYYYCHKPYHGSDRHHYYNSSSDAVIIKDDIISGPMDSLAYIRHKRQAIDGTAAAGAVVGGGVDGVVVVVGSDNTAIASVSDDGISDNKYSARDFANTKGMSSNAVDLSLQSMHKTITTSSDPYMNTRIESNWELNETSRSLFIALSTATTTHTPLAPVVDTDSASGPTLLSNGGHSGGGQWPASGRSDAESPIGSHGSSGGDNDGGYGGQHHNSHSIGREEDEPEVDFKSRQHHKQHEDRDGDKGREVVVVDSEVVKVVDNEKVLISGGSSDTDSDVRAGGGVDTTGGQPFWSNWSEWSPCRGLNNKCDSGRIHSRIRKCLAQNGDIVNSDICRVSHKEQQELEIRDCRCDSDAQQQQPTSKQQLLHEYNVNSTTVSAGNESSQHYGAEQTDRACNDCNQNEICLLQVKAAVPFCAKIKDPRDPRGCGGWCSGHKELCRYVGAQTYQCVDDSEGVAVGVQDIKSCADMWAHRHINVSTIQETE
ncbi:unnamed protein product [Medioppia subpectinata]|uniref:Uncharacterized protein n=1 Tax=Medioppia subpectinata TaxID=1979941 RepID=A0A7R9PTB4_9ACAR|nr:unnamed protein product [Medioppia subpectinata]CAG2100262.1 unnamed protein product [Medioppia subpectinata]